MRSRLLDRPTLESLVARHDLGYLASTLEAGAYAADFAAARAASPLDARPDVDSIDLALTGHLARTGHAILSYYEGTARDLVLLLLRERDLGNLLAAIRGRAAGVEASEVARLYVLGGELTVEWLGRIVGGAQADGYRLLGDWLGGAAVTSDGEGRQAELESSVVRRSYARTLSRLKGGRADVATVRRVLEWRIDVLNLTMALRICRQPPAQRPSDLSWLFLRRGTVESKSLESICRAPDLEAATADLERTPYREAIGEANLYLARVGRASALQCALERLLVRRATRLYRADPLGIGVVVGYLAAQSTEVANLRLIARCLALGLDKRDVFDQIWLPEA